MNQQAIEQLGRALDLVFGKPGAAQVALANLDLIKALDEAVKAYHAAAQQAQKEQEDGAVHSHD